VERDEFPKNHARTIFVVLVWGLPLLPLTKWLEPVVVVVLFLVLVEVILLGLTLLPQMQWLEPVVVVVLAFGWSYIIGIAILASNAMAGASCGCGFGWGYIIGIDIRQCNNAWAWF
jgi:hypothetical protein